MLIRGGLESAHGKDSSFIQDLLLVGEEEEEEGGGGENGKLQMIKPFHREKIPTFFLF